MTFVYILLAIIILLLVLFLYRLQQSSKTDQMSDEFFKKFNEKFPSILNQANTNLVNLASQNLEAKKDTIELMVKRVLEELRIQSKSLQDAEKDRIGSFENLKQSIENNRKLTEQLSTTTENLRKVLSNNQLRGAFGEKVAEDLLKIGGFVSGVDYEFNRSQENGSTRPDFAIFLPNSTRINVDAKFPYSNLQKMTEAETKSQKEDLAKAFERDVREKVKQCSSRDYINPQNNTVDFVILFIPNEMIFSYIYDKLPSVWEEALSKKVVLCGPFSFTAILRLVRQAYDNFHFQKNITQIINLIHQFGKEFEKYNDEFVKIGSKIEGLSRQYDAVNDTRTRKLLRVIDQIKLDKSTSETQPQKQLL